MSSTEGYLAYVMDLLSEAEGITHRKMMGEYVLYCQGRVFGGVYDDRFLVKPTDAARRLLPDADVEAPYDGAKPMVVVNTEDRHRIAEVVAAMVPELPQPKQRKK